MDDRRRAESCKALGVLAVAAARARLGDEAYDALYDEDGNRRSGKRLGGAWIVKGQATDDLASCVCEDGE